MMRPADPTRVGLGVKGNHKGLKMKLPTRLLRSSLPEGAQSVVSTASREEV